MPLRAVQQQDAADEVRAFTVAALAADLGVGRTKMTLARAAKQAGIGAIAALALVTALLVSFPGPVSFEALLIGPGGLLLPVLTFLIPSSVVYWAVPGGGPPAGLLLILIGAAIFWAATGCVVGAALSRLTKVGRKHPGPLLGSSKG